MGHLMFYLAAVAACLLWSSAFVAAAARVERPWLRRLLVAVAVVVPPLGIAPWVWFTGGLAMMGLRVNWFAPTLTAFIAALVGGLWIVAAGLSRRSAARPAAAAWPLVALAAGFALAKAVAFGTLVFIDNAVAAEGRMLRVEAAQMMAAALPPAPATDDDAAPLYHRAFAALAADPTLGAEGSPVANPLTADVDAPEVAAILARHAAAIDLVRRAADRPGCRFTRDWSRPSISMLLPEIQVMRQAARVLALAARREAATGDAAAALADVVRIHRVGTHAATDPILVCGLVGQAIDTLALQTLADVLPRLGVEDLPRLDTELFRDFVETPVSYQRAFLGEEAFGLATIADLADGRQSIGFIRSLTGDPDDGRAVGDSILLEPFSLLFRCFLLPADVAGYRDVLCRYRGIVGSMVGPPPRTHAEIATRLAEVEEQIKTRRAGIFSGLMAPALSGVLTTQAKNQALHATAAVLVAATRARLSGGVVPDAVVDLVPTTLRAVPRDPFTAEESLLAKRVDGDWVVYSVGPDGEDDGGPPAAGAESPQANDDVGLRMATGR